MAPSEHLISLVYLSAATVWFSNQDLTDLLAKARENNTKLGVSGMLLFKEGNFLQVLEGESSTVIALFKKISKDPRHRKVVALSQAPIHQKDFPDWSMGFKDLSATAERPEGFTPFLSRAFTIDDFSVDPGSAKKLLLLFKEDKLLAKATSGQT